jgi:hypothetical protein
VGADSGGTCTLRNPVPYVGTHPSIYATVALNSVQWYNSLPCGGCLNVTASGTGAPTTPNFLVYIDNLCPECNTGDIDFALTGNDRWSVTWEMVDCPVDTTYVQYLFTGNSDAYYLKLQVRNTRVPTSSLSIQQSGTWYTLPKENDNFWLSTGSGLTTPITSPLQIMLVSASGDVIYDTITTITNDVAIAGNVQFPPTFGTNTSSYTTSSSASATSSATSGGGGASTGAASSTASGGGSSTGASSTTSSATASQSIFSGTLQSGWTSYGWATDLTFNATAYVYSGEYSISFTPSNFAAVYLHQQTPFDPNNYKSFQFYINGGQNSGQPLQVIFYNAAGTTFGNVIPLPVPVAANTWVLEAIPTSQFGIPTGTQLGGIAIQGASSDTIPIVYIDDLSFVAPVSQSTSGATAATGTTASTTDNKPSHIVASSGRSLSSQSSSFIIITFYLFASVLLLLLVL